MGLPLIDAYPSLLFTEAQNKNSNCFHKQIRHGIAMPETFLKYVLSPLENYGITTECICKLQRNIFKRSKNTSEPCSLKSVHNSLTQMNLDGSISIKV